MTDNISARCDVIEECYEFLLAYAGQGLSGDGTNAATGKAREYLRQAAQALSGLTQVCAAELKPQGDDPPEAYDAFLEVLDRDVGSSLAAIRLVLAQPFLSSQLIDNLNASIHLRALLTDLFLIDEVLKLRQLRGKSATIE